MTSKLLVLSLVVGSTWAGSDPAPEFTATCNNDNTLTITVPFPRTADILELNYGSCTHNSSTGVQGLAQNTTDLSFEILLDIAECGMDQTLRMLEYTQHVYMRIGRKSTDMLTGASVEMTYEHYEIDGYCSIEDSYEVVFDYHNLTQFADTTNLTGEATVSFMIKAYDEAFNTSDFAHSTVAGNFIYLGLTVADGQVFNFDDVEFAPTKCMIDDTVNGFAYTLFNAMVSGGCSNSDVDFSIAYDPAKGMWQITHILFLLGDIDESSFLLSCTVKVCNIAADSDCDTVKTECAVTTTASESASFAMTSSTTLMDVFENDLTQLDDIVTDSLVPGIVDSLGNIVDSVEIAPGNHSVGSTIVSSYNVNITTTTFNPSRRRRAVALILALLFEDVTFLEEVKDTLFEEFVEIAEKLNITLDVTEFTLDGITEPENVTCADGKYLVDGICTLKQCNCDYGVGYTGTDCPTAGDLLCESCDDGYYLDGVSCPANVCTCDGGTGFTGPGCDSNGGVACESCSDGYYLDAGVCEGTWETYNFAIMQYSGANHDSEWKTIEDGMKAWGDRNYVYTGPPSFIANDQCRYIMATNHKQMDGTYTVQISSDPVDFTAYILAESCKVVGWSDHDCNHDGLLHENLFDPTLADTPWVYIDPSTHDMRHTSNNGGLSIFKQEFSGRNSFEFKVDLVEPKNDRAWLGGVIICTGSTGTETTISCETGQYMYFDNADLSYKCACGAGYKLEAGTCVADSWENIGYTIMQYSGANHNTEWVTISDGMKAWGDRNYVYTGPPAFIANDHCRYIMATNHKQMDGTYTVQVHSEATDFTAYILAESCKEVGWSDHDCNHDGLLHENLVDAALVDTPWELIDPMSHDMRHTSNNGGLSIFKQEFSGRNSFEFKVELVEPKNDRAWLGGVIICAPAHDD